MSPTWNRRQPVPGRVCLDSSQTLVLERASEAGRAWLRPTCLAAAAAAEARQAGTGAKRVQGGATGPCSVPNPGKAGSGRGPESWLRPPGGGLSTRYTRGLWPKRTQKGGESVSPSRLVSSVRENREDTSSRKGRHVTFGAGTWPSRYGCRLNLMFINTDNSLYGPHGDITRTLKSNYVFRASVNVFCRITPTGSSPASFICFFLSL